MKKNWFFILNVCLIGLVGCPIINKPRPVVTLPCGLTAEVIDEAGTFRSDTAIAVDHEGNVHLVYHLSADDGSYHRHFAYATNASGAWRTKKDWQIEAFGTYSAIAVDSHNKVHICTTGGHGAGENLVYFTNQSGHWTETVVDEGLSVGLENDIALDQNDKVHLSYWQWNGNNLRYATNLTGNWQSQEVDSGQVYWYPTSIFFGPDSEINIFYYGGFGPSLASQTADAWSIETIPLINLGQGFCALSDSAGNIYAVSNNGLLCRINGVWRQENIFGDMLSGASNSLIHLDEDALSQDRQGKLHLCFLLTYPTGYNGLYDFRLYYATNLNGAWQPAEIDNWQGNGNRYDEGLFPPGLTTDSAGDVHLVYVRNQPNLTDQYEVRYCTFGPQDLLNDAGQRTLEFASYEWLVKKAYYPTEPGQNYFSDRPENVWTDEEGLHLTIAQDGKLASWYSSEVYLNQSLGFGTYCFSAKGPLDVLDPNVVFAGFTYGTREKTVQHREFDFEFTRWGDPSDPTNAQFAINPFIFGQVQRYQLALASDQAEVTCFLVWQSDNVDLRTYLGRFDLNNLPPESALVSQTTYSQSDIPGPLDERWHFNLWLNDNAGPSDDQPVEVTVTDFAWQAEAPQWPSEGEGEGEMLEFTDTACEK